MNWALSTLRENCRMKKNLEFSKQLISNHWIKILLLLFQKNLSIEFKVYRLNLGQTPCARGQCHCWTSNSLLVSFSRQTRALLFFLLVLHDMLSKFRNRWFCRRSLWCKFPFRFLYKLYRSASLLDWTQFCQSDQISIHRCTYYLF